MFWSILKISKIFRDFKWFWRLQDVSEESEGFENISSDFKKLQKISRDWVYEWLIDWGSVLVFEWMFDWMSDSLNEWVRERSIEWMVK